MNRKDFFNSMADTWDTICRHDRDRINKILDLLRIRSGDAVLDVGTGTGVLIPFLLDRVGDRGTITAIDMAEKMIQMAENKYCCENVLFIADDVFTAGLRLSAFDVVICYSVFPHFDDKSNAVKLLVQYLRAGGTVAICHSQGRDVINRIHETISPAVARDHLPPAQMVAGYVSDAGCEITTLLDTEELYIVAGRKRHTTVETTGGGVSTGIIEDGCTSKRESGSGEE